MWEIWSEQERQTQTLDLQIWPRRNGWVLLFAHWLCELNLVAKLHANPSTTYEEIRKDKKRRLKHLTSKCDIDLEQKWLTHAFCTLSLRASHLRKVFLICFKECGKCRADMKRWLIIRHSSLTLTLTQNGSLMHIVSVS